MVLGAGLFLGVMSVLVWFLSKPPPKKEISKSMHSQALKFGIEWIKREIFTAEDEHFYFPQTRTRTLEDFRDKRIYFGFKIRRAKNDQIICFVISKPSDGNMDMWDYYDYPTQNIIANPLHYVERMMRERWKTAYMDDRRRMKPVIRQEIGYTGEMSEEPREGELAGPRKRSRW